MAQHGTPVRPVEPSDIPDLVALCLEAREESTVGPQLCTADPELLASQLRAFAASPECRLLVADHEGYVAGMLMARVVPPGPFVDEATVHVEAVYVEERHRRRGVGHALMSELLHVAEAAGARHLYAVPLPGARGMQRFLARLGFAPAASHRFATVETVQRRLLPVRRQSRPRGLENLIARRRVAREEGGTGEIAAALVRERVGLRSLRG